MYNINMKNIKSNHGGSSSGNTGAGGPVTPAPAPKPTGEGK